jgi:hypothetical protein
LFPKKTVDRGEECVYSHHIFTGEEMQMPRKNFYVPDAEVEVYEKAKEYVGDSISSFIMDGLKKLVNDMEAKAKSLNEIRLWVGEENDVFDSKTGEYVKFIGRLLGQGTIDDISSHVFELYETKKGNFLLHTVHDNNQGLSTSSYSIYKEYKEVTKLNLPSSLYKEAETKLGNFRCVELDV